MLVQLGFAEQGQQTLSEPFKNKPANIGVWKRPLQQERDQFNATKQCLLDLKRTGSALLAASCGSGKSTMALYCGWKLQARCLIVTFREFSAKQWVQEVSNSIEGCGMGAHIDRMDDCTLEVFQAHTWIVMVAQFMIYKKKDEVDQFSLRVPQACLVCSHRTHV